MKRFLCAMVAAVVLVGCGSPTTYKRALLPPPTGGYVVELVTDKTGKVSSETLALMRDYLTEQLNDRGLLASDASQARKIQLTTVGYKMRRADARILFGGLAGKDEIQTVVTFTDSGGEPAGEMLVRTYSQTAAGGDEHIAHIQIRKIRDILVAKAKQRRS